MAKVSRARHFHVASQSLWSRRLSRSFIRNLYSHAKVLLKVALASWLEKLFARLCAENLECFTRLCVLPKLYCCLYSSTWIKTLDSSCLIFYYWAIWFLEGAIDVGQWLLLRRSRKCRMWLGCLPSCVSKVAKLADESKYYSEILLQSFFEHH